MAEHTVELHENHKKKRDRSPVYPGIALQVALDRARVLYSKEGRHAAPARAVMMHWGYQPKSGGGMVTLAALKRFGLIDDEGSGDNRKVKLTDLALRILLNPDEAAPERWEAIRKAALAPAIHSELWEKYQGSLPSEETLKFYLKVERGFTESGAADFTRQLLDTISYAKLSESGKLSEVISDDGGNVMPTGTQVQKIELPAGTIPRQTEHPEMIMVFRVREGNIELKMPAELSAKSYKHFRSWLNLISNLVEEEIKDGRVEEKG